MAAGFIDPLFSTGFVLSLLGIERLCDWMEAGEPQEKLDRYGVETLADLDATADLVGAAYRTLDDPESFEAVSMLYFAAASYSECARRLGKPGLAPGFLLRSHPRFGPGFRECLLAAGRAHPDALAAQVASVVRPFNVAGLCDPSKRGWYPVAAADLLGASDTLGSDPDEIRAMLRRTGFDG
jgi:FADH2 O2-dependent halogenase